MTVEAETKVAFIFDVIEREPFLEQLLLRIVKRFCLIHCIFFDEENTMLILNLQGKQKDIRDFSDAFSLEFPISLVFHFKRVVVLNSDAVVQISASSLPTFTATLQEQRILPQDSLPLMEDIYKLKYFPYRGRVFLERREILNQGQEAQYSVVAEIFRALAQKIMQGESVCMQTLYGMKVFTLDSSKREWIMPSDLAALKSYFHVSVAQMEALNSWEKPIVFLSLLEPLNDQRSQEACHFSSHTATVIAFNEAVVMPYDYSIVLLVRYLKEFGVDLCYIYTPENSDVLDSFDHVFLADQLIAMKPMKVCMANNHQWVNMSKERSVLDCSHYLCAFYKESRLEGNGIALHVSYDLPTLGVLIDQESTKRLLNITLQLTTIDFKDSCDMDDVIMKFPYMQIFLEQHTDFISHNLFDILALVHRLLYANNIDLDAAKNIMLQMAESFVGDALEIDFTYRIEDDEMILNPLSILQSCMQWQLQGISKEQLAFSLIVNMAKFYATFIEYACKAHDSDQVLLSGSMLAYTPFFDSLMNALPVFGKYTLPYMLPLDCVKSTTKWYKLC